MFLLLKQKVQILIKNWWYFQIEMETFFVTVSKSSSHVNDEENNALLCSPCIALSVRCVHIIFAYLNLIMSNKLFRTHYLICSQHGNMPWLLMCMYLARKVVYFSLWHSANIRNIWIFWLDQKLILKPAYFTACK